jgi:hydrogenase maturation protease
MVSDRAAQLPLIVGIGNRFRMDDGVGPWVAGTLQAAGRETRSHAGDGTGLLDLFEEHDDIILVDATRSGAAPGNLFFFDACAEPLRADMFHYSTHRFGLAEAVKTARALGLLPDRLRIYCIEGKHFGSCIGLTACVEQTALELVTKLASGPTDNA